MKKIFVLLLISMFALVSCNQNKPKGTMMLIETKYGNMKVLLYDSTPKHKANFLSLVKEGYYNDLLFHRVIMHFMMQGGDPVSKDAPQGILLGNGGPNYTIPAEIGKYHFKGALAAARLGDQANPAKASSGSQFYIVQGKPVTQAEITMMTANKNIKYTPEEIKKYETLGGAPFLDGDYTVFGEVVDGLDVIDAVCKQKCDQNNRPLEDIKMKIRLL